jgi:uncharacterized protein YndB with AHSA1/START domain
MKTMNEGDLEFEAARIAEVTIQIRLEASRERVWQGLTTEIGKWWPESFFSGGEAGRRSFHLETRPGGGMWEEWDNGGGLLWATVVAVHPNEKLEVKGDVSPTWGGPGTWIGTWVLEGESEETQLTFTESVFGRVTQRYQQDKEKGWKFLFDQALRAHLSGEARPEWAG